MLDPTSPRGRTACGITYFVSPEDRDLLKLNWYSFRSKGGQSYLYRMAKTPPDGKYRNVRLHGMVANRMGLVAGPQEYFDHEDGYVFNNTRENLRVLSKAASNVNRRFLKGSNLGYYGVALNTCPKMKNKPYRAYFRGKQKSFVLLEDALSWRVEAVRLFWEQHNA